MDSTKEILFKDNKNENEGKKEEWSEIEDSSLCHSSESGKKEEENYKKTKEKIAENEETKLNAKELSAKTLLKQGDVPTASSHPFVMTSQFQSTAHLQSIAC